VVAFLDLMLFKLLRQQAPASLESPISSTPDVGLSRRWAVKTC
jgi:hypothetical protein